jgi:hypothetical protein
VGDEVPVKTPKWPSPHIEYDGPPVGAIRWDAWTNDPELPLWRATGRSRSIPSGSRYHFREPSLWDEFQLYGPGVDTPTIIEREIESARGKLDYWLFDWYPPEELLEPDDVVPQCSYQIPFNAYLASRIKKDMKFALLLQWGWMVYPVGTGKYFHSFVEWIADKVRDPQYQRIDGKPLIVLYGDGTDGDGGWKGHPDRWTELKSAVGEPIFGVSVNSISMLQALDLQGNMLYGPNGADHSGTGRRSYAAQMAIDALRDGAVPGALPISSRTALNDHRPLVAENPESSTWWVDQPAQPEWVSTMDSAIRNGQKLVVVYSWNEITESGPGIVPTIQEGTRYLDAIGWVRDRRFPASYTYPLDFSSLYVASEGSWIYSFPDPPNVIAAHDGDEVLSQTPGDYKEFTHPALQELHIHATTGPDRGKMDLLQDCGNQLTVDLYSASPEVSADVAILRFRGAPTAHSVRVTVRGDKNPASSSVEVGLDYAEVTYSPSAASRE